MSSLVNQWKQEQDSDCDLIMFIYHYQSNKVESLPFRIRLEAHSLNSSTQPQQVGPGLFACLCRSSESVKETLIVLESKVLYKWQNLKRQETNPGGFRDDRQGPLPFPVPPGLGPSCGCAPLVYRTEYKEYYEPRDLKAFSAEPLLIYPTHYTGQPGYLSDTETSTIWDNETVATDWDRTHSWKSRKQGHIHSNAKNTEALPPPASLDTVPSRDEL